MAFSTSSCRCENEKATRRRGGGNKSNNKRRTRVNHASRGRFGGGDDDDYEPISDRYEDCVTDTSPPTASVAGQSRGRMGVASLRTNKPLCREGKEKASVEDEESEEEDESSGYIPPF